MSHGSQNTRSHPSLPGIRVAVAALMCLAGPISTNAETRLPTPFEDDANLNDVAFVGTQTGWAVGDRGVVWRTSDAGMSWTFSTVGEECSLESACLLTNRVGWVAGSVLKPVVGERGVIFFTSDGGETWTPLHTKIRLPPIQAIHFSDRERGYAVGAPARGFASGVMQTADGGLNWEAFGEQSAHWQAAAFLRSAEATGAMGVVVGDSGSTALIGGDRLMPSAFAAGGSRAIRDVALTRDDGGWMVGDGALLRRTDTGGVVWTEPPVLLPVELRDFVDFRAVATFESHVWIAGDPGSVVWHSPDGGRSWTTHATDHNLPISKLHFATPTNGIAVGEMGSILRTEDGGKTWSAVRGASRRAALLAVPARPERVPLQLLTKYAGNSGYRTCVAIPTVDTEKRSQLANGLRTATRVAGGNAATVDWRFPLGPPGIERSRERLIVHWNRALEGRMVPVLLGRLVSQLRTYRPTVVVVDSESPEDAASTLLNEAVRRAVVAAGDASQFPEHHVLAGLAPWKVQRVAQRLPDGSSGPIPIDAFEYLPQSQQTNRVIATRAMRILSENVELSSETYKVIPLLQEDLVERDLFRGLNLPHDSPARRAQVPFDSDTLEAGLAIATRQRNVRNWSERSFQDASVAAASLAELREITSGLSDLQAAQQLTEIAADLKQRSHWELAAATLRELVHRFPNEPPAADAMDWLTKWHSSAEAIWQRHRRLKTSEQSEGRRTIIRASAVRSEQSSFDEAVAESLNAAAQAAAKMQKHWPQLYQEPQTQLALAAFLRKRGASGGARGMLSQLIQPGAPWANAARAEFWLLSPSGEPPVKMALCRRATRRPQLDAVLSDDIWEKASELNLGTAEFDAESPLVLLAWDAQFLYLAGSFPRDSNVRNDGVKVDGRSHDERLDEFDRITFHFDVDRDYASSYSLSIDQRGCTNDRCLGDEAWNPKWYVAADADSLQWRFEAALPFAELGPTAPAPQTVWAMGLSRTIPTVREDHWAASASTRSPKNAATAFGLLRFE